MPITLPSTPAVVDLAERLLADLRAGSGSRASFGAQSQAFAWVTGMPVTVAAYVNTTEVEGGTFTAVRVAPSGTPVARVAEGAAKPVAVVLTSHVVPLVKYAGIAEYSTEDALDVAGLSSAVLATLGAGALRAFDADCVAALVADAGTVVPAAATWSAAILAGIAAVSAGGGNANLLILSGADFAEAVAPDTGYTADPVAGWSSLFGLRIVVSAGATTGSAIVMDSSAAVAGEQAGGPFVISDPFSRSDVNLCRLVAELRAALFVVSPGGIAVVSTT